MVWFVSFIKCVRREADWETDRLGLFARLEKRLAGKEEAIAFLMRSLGIIRNLVW